MISSAQEIIDKIMQEHELLHNDRFLAQIDIGRLPFREGAKVIERIGENVAPVIVAARRNKTPKNSNKILSLTSVGYSSDETRLSVTRA